MIRFTSLPKIGMKDSITYYLGGNIFWELWCCQRIGSLRQGWESLLLRGEQFVVGTKVPEALKRLLQTLKSITQQFNHRTILGQI